MMPLPGTITACSIQQPRKWLQRPAERNEAWTHIRIWLPLCLLLYCRQMKMASCSSSSLQQHLFQLNLSRTIITIATSGSKPYTMFPSRPEAVRGHSALHHVMKMFFHSQHPGSFMHILTVQLNMDRHQALNAKWSPHQRALNNDYYRAHSN